MKNLTHQDIRFLVESGFLMPPRSTMSESIILPGKPGRVKEGDHSSDNGSHPAGYPVLNTCNSRDLDDIFPVFLMEDNTKKYLMPECFYYIFNTDKKNIFSDHPHLEEKLKHWTSVAKKYISEDINEHIISDIEIELLSIFRDVYADYIIAYYPKLNILSPDFAKLYDETREYRIILQENMQVVFSNMPSRKSIFEYIFNNFIENKYSLFNFEKDMIIKCTNNSSNVAGVDFKMVSFWSDMIYNKYERKYKNDSPLLEHFKKHIYTSLSNRPSDVVPLVSWLDVYDVSMIKKELLYIFNNSNNQKTVEEIGQILKSHHIFPENAPVLLHQETKAIYKNTSVLDANNIRQKLNSSILGAETLIAIIASSFKQDESNYSDIIYEINFNEGIVKFHIEANDKNITQQLSNNFLAYVEAAMSSLFLTQDITKKLISHNNNVSRTKYEQDAAIMQTYTEIKNKFLLHAQLQHDLPQPKGKIRCNKI